MGISFYKKYPVVRDLFEMAGQILGFDLSAICFKGGIVKLNRIENALLAVYVVSVGYFLVLQLHEEKRPLFFAGHSVGEYAALTCSGALSFQQGVELVRLRAELAKQEMGGQGMTVIKGIAPAEVESYCSTRNPGEMVTIGCYNSPLQVMLSGHETALKKIEALLLREYPHAEVLPLASCPAFHSPLLEGASHKLKGYLESCTWGSWTYPVISNVTAQPYSTPEEAIDLLTLQLHKPVQWTRTLDFFKSANVRALIEVGPQTILKQLTPPDSIPCFSLDHKIDREKLTVCLTN